LVWRIIYEKITRNGQGAPILQVRMALSCFNGQMEKQIVLIEWKYTESYSPTPLMIAASGTDRRNIYKHLFVSDDCPINKQILPSFDSLFYEPFYQLMRQQFLASEMEKAHELGADFVSLLHIAPAHNLDFRRITSRELENLGESATDVWKKLVVSEGKFLSLSTEQLFGGWTADNLPTMKSWVEYIHARYPWVGEQ
jgi:hypothetical protein